jgi:hypothetical protein
MHASAFLEADRRSSMSEREDRAVEPVPSGVSPLSDLTTSLTGEFLSYLLLCWVGGERRSSIDSCGSKCLVRRTVHHTLYVLKTWSTRQLVHPGCAPSTNPKISSHLAVYYSPILMITQFIHSNIFRSGTRICSSSWQLVLGSSSEAAHPGTLGS